MRFDLEQAILHWKRSLRKHRSFEDGDIEELEDHFRSRVESFVEAGFTEKEAYREALSKDYPDLGLLDRAFKDEKAIYTSSARFFGNFLKVGMRSILKHRSYSVLNITGLSVGFACVFGIIIYLHQELSFDRFNENGEQLYRVNMHMVRASGEIHYPIIPPAFGPELRENVAGIKRVSRLRYAYPILMRHEQHSFFEKKVFFAEADFLKMFTLPMAIGDPERALAAPNAVVITESMAEKYFGTEPALGKVINYNNEIDLQVTGVMKDVPDNAHFKFDFLISFETFVPGPGSLEPMTSWRWLGFLTYVQLEEGVDPKTISIKAQELFVANNNSMTNRRVDIEFQPLYDIYLGSGKVSNPQGGLFRINDPDNLRSLAIVAGLIIVIGFFNYFNMVTALMYTRTREMGVRKILGSGKWRIVQQMLVENCLVVLLSGLLSLAVIWGFSGYGALPQITSASLLWVLALMLVLCLGFGLINGLYLGTALASKGMLSLLKGQVNAGTSRFSVRKLILLLQYGISTSLIMISLIVVSQLNYFSQKDLGYDEEGILVAGFRGEDVEEKKDILRDALSTNPLVKAISFGPAMDGSSSGSPLRPVEWPEEEVIQTSYFGVDYDFAEVMGIEVLQGRFFDESIATDSVSGLLINETLAERLGFENPLGRKVHFATEEYTIIGVFKDFHYSSLHREIGPMALEMWLGPPRNVLVKFAAKGQDQQAIQSIERNWTEAFPGGDFPLEYRLLTDQLAGLYAKERDFALLIKLFTGLAIFVAVLGMYGFSAISAQLKIKQICIRRVLGAEFRQISRLVARDFLLFSILAAIVSIPIVYWLMSGWLENFAYSINIHPGFFVIGILITIGVTVLTLAIQVRRIMHTRPARILRNE